MWLNSMTTRAGSTSGLSAQRSHAAAKLSPHPSRAKRIYWTLSTEGDGITSSLQPRISGRSNGTARFTFRTYAPLESLQYAPDKEAEMAHYLVQVAYTPEAWAG